MSVNFDPGLHAAAGQPVDRAVYDRYLGRWSRSSSRPLGAAGIRTGHRVLGVAIGLGRRPRGAFPRFFRQQREGER